MANFGLGIDIGGTFTDVIILDRESGRHFSRKVLTTPDDPARAVMDGIITILKDEGLDAGNCDRIVHATTLFTNALIERKGAITGLLTTKGFRDTLEIGRERKYELYDLNILKSNPLVPRHRRIEIDERLDSNGQILTSIDRSQVLESAKKLVEDGVEALAVVFLHAYVNPVNEREVYSILKNAYPDLNLSISSEVAPEIREFERTSTTVINAYVKPMAEQYLDRLAEQANNLGIMAPLHLMLSAGGLTHLGEAKRFPVQMLESGPAAGALASAFFGKELETRGVLSDLIAFDMGGTTAKLAVIEEGIPRTSYAFEAARQKRFAEGSGLPVQISSVELIEIGAGGGSIAYIDDIGLLKVGPESAGAQPGPASYGFGGVKPTVTDADLVLGYLDPEDFAGGKITIDLEAGLRALSSVARKAELDELKLAAGIHDIVNENMASAARAHIAEQGRDPRDFTLVCTGGAGPVHAYGVARKLGINRLLFPPSAGVASALGLLVAPARVDKVSSINFPVSDGNLVGLETSLVGLEKDAIEIFKGTGLPLEDIVHHRLADGRFMGQSFELVVHLPKGPYDIGDPSAIRRQLSDAFQNAYRQRFSRTPPNVPIEFINARVSSRLAVPGGEQVLKAPVQTTTNSERGRRNVYFQDFDSMIETAVHDRSQMNAGTSLTGPAVVVDSGSTLIVGPGAQLQVLKSGNIMVHLPEREERR